MLRNTWLTQILIAVTLVSLAAWQLNLANLASAFSGVRYEWLGVALLVYIAARAINAWEWQTLLTKVGRAPIIGLFGALLIGTLVNAVVPANLGDVAKLQIVANRYSLPRAGLVAGRGSEAVVNATMFVGFVLLSVAVARGGVSSQNQPLLWVLAAACAVASFGAVIGSRMLPNILPEWQLLRRLPHRVYTSLEQQWPRFHDGFEVIRRPRLFGILLLVGLVGWGIDLLINWSYGNAFNLSLPFSAYVSVTVALAVITTFPITFGNIGTWEFAVLGVFALYGVPADRALAYAVGSHIFVTAFNMGLGLIAMVFMGVSLGDVFRLRGERSDGGSVGISGGVSSARGFDDSQSA